MTKKKSTKKSKTTNSNVNTNKNNIKININTAPKRKYVRKTPAQPKQNNHYITVNNSGPAPYVVPLQASPLLQPQQFPFYHEDPPVNYTPKISVPVSINTPSKLLAISTKKSGVPINIAGPPIISVPNKIPSTFSHTPSNISIGHTVTDPTIYDFTQPNNISSEAVLPYHFNKFNKIIHDKALVQLNNETADDYMTAKNYSKQHNATALLYHNMKAKQINNLTNQAADIIHDENMTKKGFNTFRANLKENKDIRVTKENKKRMTDELRGHLHTELASGYISGPLRLPNSPEMIPDKTSAKHRLMYTNKGVKSNKKTLFFEPTATEATVTGNTFTVPNTVHNHHSHVITNTSQEFSAKGTSQYALTNPNNIEDPMYKTVSPKKIISNIKSNSPPPIRSAVITDEFIIKKPERKKKGVELTEAEAAAAAAWRLHQRTLKYRESHPDARSNNVKPKTISELAAKDARNRAITAESDAKKKIGKAGVLK